MKNAIGLEIMITKLRPVDLNRELLWVKFKLTVFPNGHKVSQFSMCVDR
jgi:hypothetical protein